VVGLKGFGLFYLEIPLTWKYSNEGIAINNTST